jgi:hypothetical protein
VGNVLVGEAAHRVDEDNLRCLPAKRLGEFLRESQPLSAVHDPTKTGVTRAFFLPLKIQGAFLWTDRSRGGATDWLRIVKIADAFGTRRSSR